MNLRSLGTNSVNHREAARPSRRRFANRFGAAPRTVWYRQNSLIRRRVRVATTRQTWIARNTTPFRKSPLQTICVGIRSFAIAFPMTYLVSARGLLRGQLGRQIDSIDYRSRASKSLSDPSNCGSQAFCHARKEILAQAPKYGTLDLAPCKRRQRERVPRPHWR